MREKVVSVVGLRTHELNWVSCRFVGVSDVRPLARVGVLGFELMNGQRLRIFCDGR